MHRHQAIPRAQEGGEPSPKRAEPVSVRSVTGNARTDGARTDRRSSNRNISGNTRGNTRNSRRGTRSSRTHNGSTGNPDARSRPRRLLLSPGRPRPRPSPNPSEPQPKSAAPRLQALSRQAKLLAFSSGFHLFSTASELLMVESDPLKL